MDEGQCQRLGGEADKICMVDGFPTATGDEIHTPILHEMIRECEILHLRPQDFLAIVPPPPEFHRPTIEKLKQKIKRKVPLDPLQIELTVEDCGWQWKLPCITEHEGRHRAKAAQELGLSHIPVLLCRKYPHI